VHEARGYQQRREETLPTQGLEEIFVLVFLLLLFFVF